MSITVAHLISTSFFGGPEKQITEHLKRLDKTNYRGMLISFTENGQENETLSYANRIDLENYGINTVSPLDVRALIHLSALIRRKNVVLLCTHGYKSVVLGWIAARLRRIPVLAFSRGYTSEDVKVRFYEFLERRFLEKSDGIVFVSEGQRRRLKDLGVRGKRSWVVHNAVSIPKNNGFPNTSFDEELRKELGILPDSTITVSAGRLSPEKGHRFLVEAVHLIKEKKPRVYVLFCGDGKERSKLEQMAHKLGVNDRCKFMGFRRDLERILGAMDFMVLPSLTEGLPNVILESFALGKTVIATSVGGVPEIVEDGVNGILVPAKRSDLLAEAIIRLSRNPLERLSMGKEGRKTVEERFSFDKQNRKLEAIYREIIANR